MSRSPHLGLERVSTPIYTNVSSRSRGNMSRVHPWQLVHRILCARETTRGRMAWRMRHRREVGASPGMLGLLVRTHSLSYVQVSSIQAGSAVVAAEEKKTLTYSDIVSGVNLPIHRRVLGLWGEHALEIVTEIVRRIAAVTHDPRSTLFLRQRLSLAV